MGVFLASLVGEWHLDFTLKIPRGNIWYVHLNFLGVGMGKSFIKGISGEICVILFSNFMLQLSHDFPLVLTAIENPIIGFYKLPSLELMDFCAIFGFVCLFLKLLWEEVNSGTLEMKYYDLGICCCIT